MGVSFEMDNTGKMRKGRIWRRSRKRM